MTLFKYKARNVNGEQVYGKVEALSRESAATQLLQEKLIPIEIKAATVAASFFEQLEKKLLPGYVKSEDLIAFCRQMYALVKAGVPIINALTYLVDSTRSSVLAESIRGIINLIASGQTLTQAFTKFPYVFSPIFVSMIEAGENSGQLDNTFLRLTEHLELESKTAKQIKSVIRYPLLVITAIIGALAVINFMVVPSFAKLFASFKTELPLPTRFLIGMSNFFVANWIYILIGIIIVIFIIRRSINTTNGRFVWDHYKLKIPIIGQIINRIVLARFARMLAMMIRTGLPIAQSLLLVSNVVGNAFVRERILFIRSGVEHGDTISKKSAESKLFESMVLQMITVGEETGSIDTLLQDVAEYYESEVEYDLRRLTDLIEPFLLVFMGAMVLVLALGVFLPMWDMVKFTKT